jgi:membrane AbrB-like protein
MARPHVDAETTARTLAIGIAGGAVFWLGGMPLAFLSGSAAAVAGAALAGFRVGINERLREFFIILLGLTLGSTVTPETLALLPRWPVTLAGLAAAMLTIMGSGAWYLEKVHGLDRATARLAAMPGALNFVMALSLETHSDPRRVAIIQIVRIMAILLLLPSIVTLVGGQVTGGVFQPAGDVVKPLQLAVLVPAGIAAAFLFKRLGTPAPQLFGAMVAAALLYGTGLCDSAMPHPLLLATFVVLGSMIGSNFAGADMRLFAEMVVAGVGSLAVSSLVALAWALPLAWLVGLPTIQVWLAYAPGGVETTALLAMALGLDAAFVSSHHIMRVIILNSLVTFWLAPFMRKADDDKP